MNNLHKDLLYALFKFRNTAFRLSNDSSLRLNEVIALGIIDRQSHGDEKSPLASEVGDALCISLSAVSQILTALEKKGYVSRNISESDKRQYRFTLTESGRRTTYEMKKMIDARIDAIIASVGEARIKELAGTINEIADCLSRMQND